MTCFYVVSSHIFLFSCHSERSEESHSRSFGLWPQDDKTIIYESDVPISLASEYLALPVRTRSRAACRICDQDMDQSKLYEIYCR
jgi:hypothetical protein